MLRKILHHLDKKRIIRQKEAIREAILRSGIMFVDIPRTSSTSLRIQLAKAHKIYAKAYYKSHDLTAISSPSHLCLPPHLPATVIRGYLGIDVWQQVFSFSIVRNPWDRMVSIYRYRVEREQETHSFEEFVRELRTPRLHLPDSFLHWEHWRLSQTSFLSDEMDQIMVNQVYRFENLADTYSDLSRRLEVPISPAIRLEPTDRHKDYREYYSDRTRQTVSQYYAQDIENFGYTF